MTIGCLNYRLPREGQKSGGVDRVAHELAQGLAERGHSVRMWSADPAPPGATYRVLPHRGTALLNHPLGLRLTMGYLGNVLNVLHDFDECDVLIAHGDSLLLPLCNRPVLRVMHGSAWGEARSARTVWRFVSQLAIYPLELLSAMTQPAVGVSSNTRRHNRFVRRVIPLGVDLRRFRPATPSEKTAHPSLVFVGALSGRKRGSLLIEWFTDSIRPRFPDATLEMVAQPGPPVAGVNYHAGISDAQLAALYRRSWVYASPSSYEGFGLPYLEAMASGTPVLATPNPGSREVLAGGAYGRLAGDDEFAAQALELLADSGLRARLTTAGLTRARELSHDRMIDSYEALLTHLSCHGREAEAA